MNLLLETILEEGANANLKNIVLIAPPGAGKGTQAKMLCNKFNITHISVGDLLRKEIDEGGEYSEVLSKLMKTGQLVDDSIIFKIMENRLNSPDCSNGFILDGFPRNINQANGLQNMNVKIDAVIYLEVSKEILEHRIVGRLVCPSCGQSYNTLIDSLNSKIENICDVCNSTLEKRSDDTLEVFENRYKTYINETQPVLEFYKDKNILYNITSLDKDEIFNTIVNILGE